MADYVLFERKGHIACVTNRPDQMNALGHDVRNGLIDAFLKIRHEPSIRVAIVIGAGGQGVLRRRRSEGRFVLATHVAALSEKMTSDRDQLYAIQRAQALVIDDLGRGAESQSDVKKLGDLICERADNRLPTVCTTLTVPNYGVSVIRRMRILTV